MNNNDYFRSLRYALDLGDADLLRMFRHSGQVPDLDQVLDYLKQEEAEGYQKCSDKVFGQFLDGLIIDRRGLREPVPGKTPQPVDQEGQLSNNIILKKIRIALELDEDAMLDCLKRGNMPMSPAELGALFRKPDHRNYKPAGDQLMRYFLRGLTERLRS